MLLTRNEYKGYNFKIIKSGDITEIYAYADELVKKFGKNVEKPFTEEEVKKDIVDLKKEEKEEKEYYRRKSDIAETRKKLKRLIYANVGQYEEQDKFITLTFAEYPTREKVVKEFREFKRRFQYKYGKLFEYIAVIERGTSGTERLHIHMIVFGLPYIEHKELEKIWKNGYVYINAIYLMNDVAEYMTKYLDKTLEDGYIPKGARFYFPSKNLKKPQVEYLSDNEMYDYVNQVDVGNVIYNFSFDSKYVGICNYTKYKKME